MIVRSKYQTIEFHKARELYFGSPADAAAWLKHLGYPDPDIVRQLRGLATEYSEDLSDFRLTDEQLLERVSVLLYKRRITVQVSELSTPSSKPQPATAPGPGPAFPLSERASRSSSSSSSSSTPPASSSSSSSTQQTNESSTFSPDNAPAAQAAALVAAAASGVPFCEECSKNAS